MAQMEMNFRKAYRCWMWKEDGGFVFLNSLLYPTFKAIAKKKKLINAIHRRSLLRNAARRLVIRLRYTVALLPMRLDVCLSNCKRIPK